MLLQDVPAPPTPPPVPDFPIEVFQSGGPADFIPIFGMATAVIIVGMFVMGPIGRAIGEIIKHWLGARRPAEGSLPADVDDLHARIDQLQRQVAELAERQDFAERLLAQARREKVGPGGADVAG